MFRDQPTGKNTVEYTCISRYCWNACKSLAIDIRKEKASITYSLAKSTLQVSRKLQGTTRRDKRSRLYVGTDIVSTD